MKFMQKPFIIFIVGTTAVGKTKLSIQLCKAIGGQVINCDSKQLYKYANIMTAKATTQQIQGVPHHMLDILQLHQNCYNRNKYYSQAVKCVQNIKARGKVPVIVGGTNYYLQTLLYDIGIGQNFNEKQTINEVQGEQQQNKQKNEQISNELKKITKQQIQKMTKQQKYKLLKQVDPIMAKKLHQNDQTRINTFLLRYAETGIPPSNNYKPYVHKLRDKNTILFWIRNSDKKQLHNLMKNRINKMIQLGGLVEILAVFRYADIHGLIQGLNMGALQSIGYKQFQEVYHNVKDLFITQQLGKQQKDLIKICKYVQQNLQKIKQRLSKLQSKSIMTNKNIPLVQKCKQVLTKNTIDYSKRQITWIRNRLFACQDNRENFFILQLENKKKNVQTLIQRFQHQVKDKALQIINRIKIDGVGSIKQNSNQFKINKHESITEWKKYFCEKCNIEVNGSLEWDQHLNSRRHKQGMTKKQRMKKIREEKKKITNPKYKNQQLRNDNQKREKSENSSNSDLQQNNQSFKQSDEEEVNQQIIDKAYKINNQMQNKEQKKEQR